MVLAHRDISHLSTLRFTNWGEGGRGEGEKGGGGGIFNIVVERIPNRPLLCSYPVESIGNLREVVVGWGGGHQGRVQQNRTKHITEHNKINES
jgi:hypothetical protein